jgi:PAS domain S-box-containing protein
MVSSGRYTHINGGHQRVPFGCYKIGRVASGEDPFFITNDVVHDPRVHDHNWAQSLGLVSFAGFRLLSVDNKPVGVLALFKRREILPREEKLLVDLANTLSHVIISGLAEEQILKKNEELSASYEQIAATEEELRANLDELTRQEQMLKENEERYRQFFKTTLDSVFITTPDGRWVDCNDALVETFGYGSREEIFNVPVTAFYAQPDQRAEFLKLVERDGFVKERPLQFKKKDGTVLFGLITIVPQKNTDGSLKGFIGTVHDITGKKRVYGPHSSREPFNKDRVENLPDYILVYGQDGNILYINPAAVKALGYDADTVTGTSVLSYVAEEFRESMAAKMAERNEMGGIPIYEVELLVNGGLRKLVFVKGTQVLYDNNPATLLLLIDITQRKALEDELTARAAELAKISTAFQQANKKLMLLSSITRHDINNQLTVILGYLTLMETQQPDPVINDYYKKIITAANRISSMIRFTSEYEDIGISDPTWQDTRTIIDTATKEAPLGKIMVKNDLPAGTEVYADPLIAKVCYNLMDNAVRYGGKITTIRFTFEEHNGDHVMVCEDDGDGVVTEEKERIFDRGFGKNTGLGLALSREILSITGITIRETGKPGKGARFEMVVPKGAWRLNPGTGE